MARSQESPGRAPTVVKLLTDLVVDVLVPSLTILYNSEHEVRVHVCVCGVTLRQTGSQHFHTRPLTLTLRPEAKLSPNPRPSPYPRSHTND